MERFGGVGSQELLEEKLRPGSNLKAVSLCRNLVNDASSLGGQHGDQTVDLHYTRKYTTGSITISPGLHPSS